MIAGVDGYKKGWIAALDLGNDRTAVRAYPTFRAIRDNRELEEILIDVPIGLLENGSRACDLDGRRLLGHPRGSSVFPAPIRPMLAARTWEEACRILSEIEGHKCSKQTAAILPKIREVDAAMTPELQQRIHEAHPEVCFAMMNSGRAMTYRKTTNEGRLERLRLLERYFPDIRKHLSDVPGAKTDIIDAYGCLWTARRILNGEAVCFPKQEERDAHGLKVEIVA
jgi:predicted RNase H-like nuclease